MVNKNIVGKGNICGGLRRKNGGKKGGKYLNMENKIFAEETEKEENIWWRIFCGGEGKQGKYFEKENAFFAELKTHGEEKGGKYLDKENIVFCGGE